MKKICLLSVFIFSNLFSEFNVSYMLKYADGENSDTFDPDISENYIDEMKKSFKYLIKINILKFFKLY